MKKILRSPFTWGIVAVLVVCIPVILAYQFIATDLIHVGVLEGSIEYPGMGPCSLYQFSDGTPEHNAKLASTGLWPWYIHPHWKISFFRHLPSALLTLTYYIFGKTPWGYAVHSTLWYLAVVILLGLLVKRITRTGAPVPVAAKAAQIPQTPQAPQTGPREAQPGFHGNRVVAALAMIIFAFSLGNGDTIYYGAARWFCMAVTFGLIGLLLHLRWREDNWAPGRFLSPVFFILSMLCGEASLAVLAYLAAYELFAAPGSLKERVKAILPLVVILLIYMVTYRLGKYGTSFIGLYTNPLHDPAGYLAALPMKAMAIIGEMFYRLTTFYWFDYFQPANFLLLLGVTVGILLLLGLLFYPIWQASKTKNPGTGAEGSAGSEGGAGSGASGLQRHFKWLIGGMFASLLPLSSGYPKGRMAMIPLLAASIILAFILHHWLRKMRFKKEYKTIRLWLALPVCLGIVLIHLGLSPYSWYAGVKEIRVYNSEAEKFYESSILNDLHAPQKAIFLNLSDDPTLLYECQLYRKVMGLPMGESWWELSYSSLGHCWQRTAENTLELEFLGEEKQEYKAELYGLHLPGSALEKGRVTHLDGLTVTILDAGANGMPRIRFVFDYPLEDECYRFFHLNKEKKLENSPIPEVGQTLELLTDDSQKEKGSD